MHCNISYITTNIKRITMAVQNVKYFSKGQKLNWKPLKEVTSTKIVVSNLKGKKVSIKPSVSERILIP